MLPVIYIHMSNIVITPWIIFYLISSHLNLFISFSRESANFTAWIKSTFFPLFICNLFETFERRTYSWGFFWKTKKKKKSLSVGKKKKFQPDSQKVIKSMYISTMENKIVFKRAEKRHNNWSDRRIRRNRSIRVRSFPKSTECEPFREVVSRRNARVLHRGEWRKKSQLFQPKKYIFFGF